MTDEWRTLAPGRELDRFIAAQLGWREDADNPLSDGGELWLDKRGKPQWLPAYSTNLNAAWALLENTFGMLLEIRDVRPSWGIVLWQASYTSGVNDSFRRTAEVGITPAYAICRAWLKWHEEHNAR